jgi:hypothetical protein
MTMAPPPATVSPTPAALVEKRSEPDRPQTLGETFSLTVELRARGGRIMRTKCDSSTEKISLYDSSSGFKVMGWRARISEELRAG